MEENEKPEQGHGLSKTDVNGGFTSDEVKNLLFYGFPSRNSNIKIDDEDWRLDFALRYMFDYLERGTCFDRETAERVFWKRIEALANYHTTRHNSRKP